MWTRLRRRLRSNQYTKNPDGLFLNPASGLPLPIAFSIDRGEQVRGILQPPGTHQDLRHQQYGVGVRRPEQQRMAYESRRFLELSSQKRDSTELQPGFGALEFAANFGPQVSKR
jgi:hypothetical protein